MRRQAEGRKEEARRVSERAASLLRDQLSAAWEWDSFAEEWAADCLAQPEFD